jgi:hypothetical protein
MLCTEWVEARCHCFRRCCEDGATASFPVLLVVAVKARKKLGAS